MAGSVKLFQFFQQCHQINGIIPSQTIQKHLSTNLIRTISLIFSTQLWLLTAVFFAIEAKSMFSYGFSFSMLTVIITTIAVYLTFIWGSENTVKFIENCEGFIEKRVHSTAAYERLIGKIDQFHSFLCIGFCITTALLYVSVGPYSFVRHFIFDMGEDSYFLFLPSWYPFDWKTPAGYLVAWLLQCTGIVPVIIAGIQFFNILIGSCWLLIFIAEDITQDVAGFNFIAAPTKTDDNRAELMKRFCDIVQIYSDAKQLVTEVNEINEYSLFAYFSMALFALAGVLVTLQFQLWDDNSNSFEIGLTLICVIWAILVVFLLCEPGARMTNQFEIFSDEIMNGAYSYFSTFRNFEP